MDTHLTLSLVLCTNRDCHRISQSPLNYHIQRNSKDLYQKLKKCHENVEN